MKRKVTVEKLEETYHDSLGDVGTRLDEADEAKRVLKKSQEAIEERFGKDPVKRSDELDDRLEKLPNSLDETVANLVKSGDRLKRLLRYVGISIFLELVLVVAFAAVFTITQVNRSAIEQNAAAVKTSCEAGNNFRQDNLILWKYILAIPRDASLPPETVNQTEVREQFTKFVEKTFAPRNCNQLT